MKRCIFITMKDCLNGFTLAGFQQVTADQGNLLEIFTDIANNREPGLVFIDERLLTEKNRSRLQLLEKQWGGAVITIPVAGQGDESALVDYGKRFISRVLGYQMKLS